MQFVNCAQIGGEGREGGKPANAWLTTAGRRESDSGTHGRHETTTRADLAGGILSTVCKPGPDVAVRTRRGGGAYSFSSVSRSNAHKTHATLPLNLIEIQTPSWF